MHELFLTASVAGEDVETALRILQGYCGMKPMSLLRRRLYWEGPKTRQLKGIDPAFIARQGNKAPSWRSLHEPLTRQSFVLAVIYDVDREQLGKGEENENSQNAAAEGNGPMLDCDQLPGALRWNDLPDPAGARPVNSRAFVNIENEKNLCTSMKMLNHRFTNEVMQECHRFVHGNVVIDLSRYLEIPTDESRNIGGISTRLPAFESLVPFDSQNKWILTTSVAVLNGTDPEQTQKGIEELMSIKTELAIAFDLKALDRHIFDTRVKG